jgi:hypothetical protein
VRFINLGDREREGEERGKEEGEGGKRRGRK